MLVNHLEQDQIAEITANNKKEVNLPFFHEDVLYNPLLIFH